MVSEELRCAHHMKDEEGGGKKQRLVHCLPLSHVPSLRLSHSSVCQLKGIGEQDEWGGGVGWYWIVAKVFLTPNVHVILQQDDSSYL